MHVEHAHVTMSVVADWVRRNPAAVPFTWPGPIPDLARLPLLHGIVTTPRDQAELHRTLARAGYTADLLATEVGCDHWCFHHPDGRRPTWLPF